jgi:hypothetical protein
LALGQARLGKPAASLAPAKITDTISAAAALSVDGLMNFEYNDALVSLSKITVKGGR